MAPQIARTDKEKHTSLQEVMENPHKSTSGNFQDLAGNLQDIVKFARNLQVFLKICKNIARNGTLMEH